MSKSGALQRALSLCAVMCLCLTQSACADDPSNGKTVDADLGSLDGAILEDLGVFGSDAILEAPRLVVVCGESAACELDQASEEMKTNDTIPLRVSVESPAGRTIGIPVNFYFLDRTFNELEPLSLDGATIPARTAISDENGVAVMRFNSGPEGTFHLRAHAQGYGHVEWRIVVSRGRVGRIEVLAEYRPSVRQSGLDSFDTIQALLIPPERAQNICEQSDYDFEEAVGFSTRSARSTFMRRGELFEANPVFENVEPYENYTLVGMIRNQVGDLIAVGCVNQVTVTEGQTENVRMSIADLLEFFQFKGTYRFRAKLSLAGFLNQELGELTTFQEPYLSVYVLFREFEQVLQSLTRIQTDQPEQTVYLFCNFAPNLETICSRIQSYLVRGVLTPIWDDILNPDAPLLFEVFEAVANVRNFLNYIELDGWLDIAQRYPDSSGALTGGYLQIMKAKFVATEECPGPEHECKTPFIFVHELHLDDEGNFSPLAAFLDFRTSRGRLFIDYFELRIFWGRLLLGLLEQWRLPKLFNLDEPIELFDALLLSFPCELIDQFVGDEPVCESFFVSSFDRLFHQVFGEFKFGGVRYGLSGEAALTDPDRDNLIDGFVDGRMQLHLPPVTAESTVNAEERQMFRDRRRMPETEMCFSSCRCVYEPCRCELSDCELGL